MTPRLAYSLAEAAQALSLSVRSLRYLMTSGRLSFAKVGKRIVIPHAALEQLLRRATVKATQSLDADEPIRPRKHQGPHPTPRCRGDTPTVKMATPVTGPQSQSRA
jgi:excisionase family DNA binding protein